MTPVDQSAYGAPLSPLESERSEGVAALFRIALGFAALFAAAIFFLNASAVLAEGKAILTFLLSLAVLAAAVAVSRLPDARGIVTVCILLFGCALRFSFAILADAEPTSDYALFYDGAQAVLGRNLAYFDNYYFTLYPNLIPICYFFAGIFRISNTLLAVRLVNALLLSGTLVLLYLLARLYANRSAANAALLLYALYPASIIMASQLTNQTPALFLFLAGLYVLIRYQTLPAAVLSGALVAVGDLLRSEAIVLHAGLVAVCLILIVSALVKKDRAALRKRISLLLAYALTAALSGILLTGVFSRASGHTVSTDSSYAWKLVIGLNDAESGSYNGHYVEEFQQTHDAMPIVKRHIAEQDDWLDFFRRKETILWGDYEYASLSLAGLDETAPIALGPFETDLNGLVRRGQIADKAVYTAILALLAVGLAILAFRKDAPTPAEAIAILVFDAYVSAYLLIEVAPRYRYFIIPFLLLLSLPALHTAPKRLQSAKM